jgi:hypothetical protein
MTYVLRAYGHVYVGPNPEELMNEADNHGDEFGKRAVSLVCRPLQELSLTNLEAAHEAAMRAQDYHAVHTLHVERFRRLFA